MYINRYGDTFCFNIKKTVNKNLIYSFFTKKKRRCLAGPTPARAWHQWSKDQPKQQPNRGMRLFECSQKDPCTWRRHQRYEFATKSRLRLERDVALGTSNGPIVDKFWQVQSATKRNQREYTYSSLFVEKQANLIFSKGCSSQWTKPPEIEQIPLTKCSSAHRGRRWNGLCNRPGEKPQ